MKIAMRLGLAATGLLLAATLAACTASSSPTTGSTTTQTLTHSSGPVTPVPVKTGPTTSATVKDCPLLSETKAQFQSGMRLARVTVQRAGGHVVGCRFYPITHATAECPTSCFEGEHLPPGSQAAIEISSRKYTTTDGAYNAFATIARKGTSPQQVRLAKKNVGVCYRTNFWAHDHGRDIACAFSTGRTAVVVKTVVVGSSLNVVAIAKDLVSKF